MNKPTFKNRSRGRPPELQLRILKGIVLSGQLSKTEAREQSVAKYGDVSDAMDALARNHFIKFSEKRRKKGSRKHHKLYKITEGGLRYLLQTKLTPGVFWKAIILLSLCSKKPITQNEFDNYYNQFERDNLGHFSVPGYFFLTHLFDDILEQWYHTHDVYSLSPSQKVIECLALHGALTMGELIEKTEKREDTIKAINNHSINENFSLDPFLSTNTGKKRVEEKNIYHDFITHLLIIINKDGDNEKFELSLFGVLLAIAFIRRHYKFKADSANATVPSLFYEHTEGKIPADAYLDRIAQNRQDKITADSNARAPSLFYQQIDEKEYFNRIAQNHEDKIPLIFGKWRFLKAQLGEIMSYDGFDFLIFKSHRSDLLMSIWEGGNKEFYDDIYTLTHNATAILMPVYIQGRDCLELFKDVQSGLITNPRMTRVYQKIGNIKNILDYVWFITSLKRLKYSAISESDTNKLCEVRDIKKIENLFGNEVCLLFYLDLNKIAGHSNPELIRYPVLDSEGRLVLPPETEEIYRLGSPKQRLMAILTKENEIKEWFLTWIEGLIKYRKATLDEMSKFHKEVNESYKNLHSSAKIEDNMEAMLDIPRNEFDITKICSDIENVYEV